MEIIQPSQIMQLLRNETKVQHQQLEKETLPAIKAATDNESYARLLGLFYGFFRPVEQQLKAFINEHILPDIAERRQSSMLENDLEMIAPGRLASLPMAQHLPPIATPAAALGAMYVLEGSTLGGKFISKMLAGQLGRTANNGLSFFSGYGSQTDEKWAIFTRAVNEYAAAHPEQNKEMIIAANDTFSAFRNWVLLQGR